jgi:DNA-directed RNA polymerase specialized sigma24 family protein
VDVGCYYLHNRGDAEDEAQNAVLKAFQHLHQHRRGRVLDVADSDCR